MAQLLILLGQLAALKTEIQDAFAEVVKLLGQAQSLPPDEFDAKVKELDEKRAPAIAAALERIKAAIPK